MQRGLMDRIHHLKWEINGLLIKEEKMWKQRSRTLWLHKGDQNTRFFHSRASHRHRRNRIMELENLDGVLFLDEEEITNILVTYYHRLFNSTTPQNLEEALAAVPELISDEMNSLLTAEYVKAEVDEALKHMELLKAPVPDGLPPLFFQKFWSSIGEEISQVVLTCLNSSCIPSSINCIFITLIPKVKSPSRVSEFRPIALCNTIYKLVSKVITNRFKKVLFNIISESQSAFQFDKAISDNILIAFEMLHHMKTQKSKKADFMTLKLDMSKAYDRVKWQFLIKIMKKMGFCEAWIKFIFNCVSTVSYSILVNGELKGDIVLTREIQ